MRRQQRERERERERERQSERVIKREREREGKKPQPTEREREPGIFSMMGFDSVTSPFLALLVIKPNKKTAKCKI